MNQNPGQPTRILLLGGTSEIGLAILAALGAPPETEVLLAGRDQAALEAAGKTLPYVIRTYRYDATETASHDELVRDVFAGGPVDTVISAAGVLIPQPVLDQDPQQAAALIDTNFTSHVTTLLASAARMRAQGHGTIVVLSSVAAIRPRKANMVYGSAKAGLDAFARGLADSLHGTGVRVAAGPAGLRHRADDRGHGSCAHGHHARRGRRGRRGRPRRPGTARRCGYHGRWRAWPPACG